MTQIQLSVKELNAQLPGSVIKPGTFHRFQLKTVDGKTSAVALVHINSTVLESLKKDPTEVSLADLHRFIQISEDLSKRPDTRTYGINIFARIWRGIGRYLTKKVESFDLKELRKAEQERLKSFDPVNASAEDLYVAATLTKVSHRKLVLLDQARKKEPENSLYEKEFQECLAPFKEEEKNYYYLRFPSDTLEILANQGLPEAEYCYGRLLQGKEKPDLAKSYFQKAADQGNASAVFALRDLMDGNKDNDAEIIALLKGLDPKKYYHQGSLVEFLISRAKFEIDKCSKAIDEKTEMVFEKVDYFVALKDCECEDKKMAALFGLTQEDLLNAKKGDSKAMEKIGEALIAFGAFCDESKKGIEWLRRAIRAEREK